jgi:hypothetical protein
MESLLLELDKLIKDKNPELYSELMTSEESALFNSSIPEPLKQLWQWKNGQNPNYSGNFHAKTNEMLMSYQDASEVRGEFTDYVECGDISEENWKSDWLPFSENGGGNYMCLSLSSGKVFYFDKYETSTGLRFPSLKAWLEDLIDGYKKL